MADLRSIPALPDRTLAALVAEVADANVRQQAAVERLAEYLARCAAPPGNHHHFPDGWPEHAGHPDLVSTAVAARRDGVSTDTIIRRCKTEGIGKLYDGRWRVSVTRLAARRAA